MISFVWCSSWNSMVIEISTVAKGWEKSKKGHGRTSYDDESALCLVLVVGYTGAYAALKFIKCYI